MVDKFYSDSHNSECPCDICSGKITFEEMEQKNQDFLKSPGWYAHIVSDDPDSPTSFNYHTHGFDVTADHPNIQIVLPLNRDICQMIATSIYARIKKGEKFEAGKKYVEIIESNDNDRLSVMFINVTECDRSVLRIIFPDKEGHLLAKDMVAEDADYALQWS